ncbi:ribonuclease H-like domain-containing protein [Tanacetum coccineum]
MPDTWEPHLLALKRILCYVRGTLDYGIQLHASSTTQLVAYTDANWAGCLVTLHSTFGYYVFLGDNLLSCAIYLSTNHVQCQPAKQIEIDILFVRDYVASSQVRVLYVPSRFNYADIFLKGLPTAIS